MKIYIRNNKLLAGSLKGKCVYKFFEQMKPHLVDVKKSETSEADKVYKINADLVFGLKQGGDEFDVFLWKEHTTISVFLTE